MIIMEPLGPLISSPYIPLPGGLSVSRMIAYKKMSNVRRPVIRVRIDRAVCVIFLNPSISPAARLPMYRCRL
jgi:hypothetical protein